MDVRHLVAYGLIGVLIATAVGLFFYLRYQSRGNRLRRQRQREEASRKERLGTAPAGKV